MVAKALNNLLPFMSDVSRLPAKEITKTLGIKQQGPFEFRVVAQNGQGEENIYTNELPRQLPAGFEFAAIEIPLAVTPEAQNPKSIAAATVLADALGENQKVVNQKIKLEDDFDKAGNPILKLEGMDSISKIAAFERPKIKAAPAQGKVADPLAKYRVPLQPRAENRPSKVDMPSKAEKVLAGRQEDREPAR